MIHFFLNTMILSGIWENLCSTFNVGIILMLNNNDTLLIPLTIMFILSCLGNINFNGGKILISTGPQVYEMCYEFTTIVIET